MTLISLLLFLLELMFSNQLTRKVIKGIDYIDQTEKYPTGCESISTVMCLNYHGFNIEPTEFIDKYLEKGKFFLKNNKKYGPDPTKKFAGSPYDSSSYGCYEPVIAAAINKLIKERNLEDKFEVKKLTNVPVETLIVDYIDNNFPVIFWATIDFKEYYINYERDTWIIPETGKEFTWRSNEHCLLLIGYDNKTSKYIFLDPWNNHGMIEVDMDLVKQRHSEQYSMAVAIIRKD